MRWTRASLGRRRGSADRGWDAGSAATSAAGHFYASAKLENNNFGFGTDNDIEHTAGYVIIKHRTFGPAAPPTAPHVGVHAWLPCAKVLGAARGRRHAFRPVTALADVGGDPHGNSACRDEVYGYDPGWGYPSAAARAEVARLMRATAPRGGPASGRRADEARVLRSGT